MNARTQTQTATLAAMALTLALTASMAAAAPKAAERAKNTVACRTVANYDMSAWVAPTAMVLHSAGAWKAWNDEMVEAGMAVAPEALPQDVDWAKESVLVLALGEGWESRHLEMKGASRNLSGTTVTVTMEAGRGGMAPALVMAMPKSAAARVKLACTGGMALPEARTYPETALAASGDAMPVAAVAATWGAVKAEYR
jgi:hypothetical protein